MEDVFFKAFRSRRPVSCDDSAAKAVSPDDKAPSLDGTAPSPRMQMGHGSQPKNRNGIKRKRVQAWAKTTMRQRAPRADLHLIPVEAKDGMDLPCVFIPRGEKKSQDDLRAVALWPQYRVEWRSKDFAPITWLVLSNYEPWVESLVHHMTNICKKTVASVMFQKVRQLFRENITKHRGIQVPNKEDDGSQPSDVLDSDIEDGQVSLKNISLIEVQFGTQSVYVLNFLRKIILCAEDQTVEFIRNWLVPLAKETILLVAAQRNNEPTPPLLQSQESVVHSCTTVSYTHLTLPTILLV